MVSSLSAAMEVAATDEIITARSASGDRTPRDSASTAAWGSSSETVGITRSGRSRSMACRMSCG